MRMLTHAPLLAAMLAAACLALPTPASAEPTQQQAPSKSGTLAVNGVDYYYEIHGDKGEPLLLLHGGLGSIEMFGPVLPMLAAERKVIAVDLYGHGRTALTKRAWSLKGQGDDMAALVERLGFKHVDVLGYSLGGGVALRMAIQKPASVRRLVIASAGYASDGFYADMRKQQAQVGAAMAPMMKDTPMFQTYAKLAPKQEDFPRLLDILGNFMRGEYDWSAEVAKLKMPVMLVFGDSDMFRPEHMIKFYQLLGGGLRDAGWGRETMAKNRLAILPDITHYELFSSPRLATTVLPFLNARTDAKSWASQM